MKIKYPHTYALMLMVDKKYCRFVNKYKKRLDPFVRLYVKSKRFNNIAPQHLSLCYFSYPKKYSKIYIRKLVPRIIKIAKKYMPIKIEIKGLRGGWELGWKVSVIMWNIINCDKIYKFHREIVNVLKDKIHHFNDPKLDFDPHIGIALGKKENLEELKKIVKASKMEEPFKIQLSSLKIFSSNGIEKILEMR